MKQSLAIIGFSLGACMTLPASAQAEIQQLSRPTAAGVEQHNFPVLALPDGWQTNQAVSIIQGAKILVPAGQNFEDATSVIYGNAHLKSQKPDIKSLDQFIEADKALFLKEDDLTGITMGETIQDQTGRQWKTATFAPADSDTNWEIVAYGEETDKDNNGFWLTLALSSKTKAELDRYLPKFRAMVEAYH